MHNHHNHCSHISLSYCSTCDVVYCRTCGKEWSSYKFNWGYTPSTYPSWTVSDGTQVNVRTTDNTKISGEGFTCSEGHKHAE
jgi:hypothetical protein